MTGINCTYGRDDRVFEAVQSLNAAFKDKKIETVKVVLAENFSIGTYMGDAALFCLRNVLGSYKLDSLVLKDIHQIGDLTVAETKIEGARDSNTQIVLNQQYQILRVELFDKLYGVNRDQVAEEVATIPFEVQDGFIILTVTVNNDKQRLRFLFDTGADGMMVSPGLAERIGLKINKEQQASVVGGHINIKVSADNSVFLGDFELTHQSIAIFENISLEYDGIIGNTITKKYITHIDYDKKIMVLYSLGRFVSENAEMKVPVSVSTGNILIPAVLKMNENKPIHGKFAFDTGAGYHLIVFRPTVLKYRMLVDGFVQDSVGSTISMGISTPVFHGKAKSISFNKDWQIRDFPVTLMGKGGGTMSWIPQADGSLGSKFIDGYNFTINLVDKYIYFQKRG